MTIRVVTDSTSDIPEATAEAHGIVVIPVYVNIDDQSYLDGVDLTRQEFYKLLPDLPSQPTTAAPAPGAISEVYERLIAEGATEILSIHVAASLSGILNAARLGAEAVQGAKVTLFDSQQLTMGLGLLAIKAAEAARAGNSMKEIVDMLHECVGRTFVFGLLDTLEYLRRSGRVGWTEFSLGTLLRIKPLVKVHLGNVEMLDKVRTSKRAFSRLLEIVAEMEPLEKMALLHIQATADQLENFEEQTQFLSPEEERPLIVELTPALGAHIGHGGLGIACITK